MSKQPVKEHIAKSLLEANKRILELEAILDSGIRGEQLEIAMSKYNHKWRKKGE